LALFFILIMIAFTFDKMTEVKEDDEFTGPIIEYSAMEVYESCWMRSRENTTKMIRKAIRKDKR